MSDNRNGWEEYRREVMHRLDRIDRNHERLYRKVNDLCASVAALKVKAGIWGAFGGLLSVAIVVAVALIKG